MPWRCQFNPPHVSSGRPYIQSERMLRRLSPFRMVQLRRTSAIDHTVVVGGPDLDAFRRCLDEIANGTYPRRDSDDSDNSSSPPRFVLNPREVRMRARATKADIAAGRECKARQRMVR